MTEITLQLQNEEGLHARPAGVLAKTATQYQSKIEIKAKGLVKNAKSIMSILSLGLEKGDQIQLAAEGSDESEAIETLQILFQNKFEVVSS